ncbi:hypothetical protein D7B24_004549 [Verticillium nonalfalfae]|uniref:NADP-dependent oxidoreductase domain-containing protein n=1 Tax=Verticillium nonalfalfae TaxID=1051616 RepID=A0A3M9XY73_9PEZI|nr:uncharacterized protein D7B24_004549 [Verticillium nonalfalfae]RNJ52038.1 hypothetical protein D7B24_004549 [Verticillium nonalfalfae]
MPHPSKNTPVALAIGTHTWVPTPEDEVRQDEILAVLRKHHINVLDTARSYGNGASETALGNKKLAQEFKVYTKAATGVIEGTGKKDLILNFANESLKALQVDKIPLYLLHAPDETVPVNEQMDAIQTLYKEGKFVAFGLSNFSKDQVLEYHAYAKANGYVLPTVYQGSYSIAVRGNETALFPTLRELGFSIQAYSPMAAGLLAKTPEYIEQGKGSWDPSTPLGQVLRDLYYKPSYMKMLEQFGKLAEGLNISRSSLSHRWLRYHSGLDGSLGDELLIGAVTAEQLEETLLELEKGPLESWVVERIDGLWDLIKADAPIGNLESIRKVFRPLLS